VALDHSGNAWVASYGSLNTSNVTEFSSSGTALSPGTGYTATAIDSPDAIAVDGAGQIWVANTGVKNNVNANVMELSSSGSAISPDAGYQGGNINYPVGIAVDGSGNVWVVNGLNSTATQLIGVAAPVITPLSVGVRDNTLGTKP
jgi:secreted PhoX family phosphatase